MNPRATAHSAFAMCLTLSLGCAAFADKADYAAYRQVRLARTPDERLIAVRTYLTQQPDGRWHEDLSAEQHDREAEVYESGNETREGLALYLAAYPEGRFVPKVRARLAVLDQIDQRRDQERAAAEREAVERRTRDEELRRTWVTRFVGYWTELLLAVREWDAPIATIAEQNPAFSRAFGRSPRPQCNAVECVKYYRSAFGVPVPGGNRLERSVELVLRLVLRDGRVVRAELLFPQRGFSRWYELENRRAVIDGDAQSRGEAIAWAFEKVKPALVAIGDPRVELSDLTLEAIVAPSLGPTAEATDTTATDPSNQVQGLDNDGGGLRAAARSPDTAPDAPDMVIGAIVIPEHGHQVQTTVAAATSSTETAPVEGEVMTLGAIDVGSDHEATTGDDTVSIGTIEVAPSDSTPAPRVAVTLPVQLYTLVSGTLRVTLFAEAPGGWDGLRIEQVMAPPAAQRQRGAR